MMTKTYKIVGLLVALMLGGAGAAAARTVTVAWDANPVSENVTGYLLYYGTQSRSGAGFSGYAAEVDVGNVIQYAVNLPDDAATYYLAVKAYNGQGLRSDSLGGGAGRSDGPELHDRGLRRRERGDLSQRVRDGVERGPARPSPSTPRRATTWAM